MSRNITALVASILTLTAAGVMSAAIHDSQDAKKSEEPKPVPAAPAASTTPAPAVLNFKMKSLDGKDVNLSKYQGKVVLMVNTASKCGYTPQYKQLEELHEKYGSKGLAILGFPANEFGQQEPGSDSEIGEFCKKNYGVKFDMFSKVVVKGDGICPLYKHLTSSETDPKFPGEIKWNFEKFLISRDGQIVNRFNSKVKPDSEEMVKAIEAELAKTASAK